LVSIGDVRSKEPPDVPESSGLLVSSELPESVGGLASLGVVWSLGAVGSRYSGVSSLRGVSLMSCVPSGVACVRVQI
jgi:hypothetical protein